MDFKLLTNTKPLAPKGEALIGNRNELCRLENRKGVRKRINGRGKKEQKREK